MHASTPILVAQPIPGIDAPPFSLGLSQLDDEHVMADLNPLDQVHGN